MRNKKELFATAILLGAGGTVAGLAEEIHAEEVAVSEITQEDSTITDTSITIEEPKTEKEDKPENPAEPAELPDSPTLPDQTASQQTPAEKEEEPQPEEEQVQEPAAFAMQSRAVSQNTTLNGYVVQSGQTIDLSKIQADVIILQASSGYAGTNPNFNTLAQQIVNSGKQLAMYHEARTGTKEDAHMEAYHFYQTIRNFVNKGFPVLHFVNDIEAGPVWADEFIDSLYGLSGKKGIIWTDTNNLDQGDWEEAKKEYTVTTNVQKLERVVCEKANTYTLPTENNEMYRMYNPNSGEHFYTKAAQERDNLVKAGWRYESIGWTAPGKGEVVYRLYNPNAGDHHYTLNGAERDMLIQKGWRYEGTGWQAGGKTAVYRLYNPNAKSGAHHFTTSKEEYEWLARLGWRKEGVAWYGADSSVPANKFPDSDYWKNGTIYNTKKVKATGLVHINGLSYFISSVNHQMAKSRIVYIPGTMNGGIGQFSYFNENGIMVKTNFSKDGTQYQVNSGNGAILTHTDILENMREVRKPSGKTWIGYFVDEFSGVNMKMSEYMVQRSGTTLYNRLMSIALKYEGTPYVWAGKSPATGFDCSGLVTYCMKNALGINVDPYYTNAAMVYSGFCNPISESIARAGDIMFWKGTYGTNPNAITHVGIYCGNGWTYCAGDPIGFYHYSNVKKENGSIAPYLFGRLKGF